MAMELVYTSAPRGLRHGSSGFCTVAMTQGMPAPLVPRLEALGGYRPGPSGSGPVARCFWRIDGPSGPVHVLARVGPAPADHTGRTNKIATYLVLRPDELPEAGPAWLLSQPGLLRESWNGKPALIDEPVRVPAGGTAGPRVAAAWQRECGDAGWAGVVASCFLRERHVPVHVIVREETDALELMDEVIQLLPAWARWNATFSTYFLQAVAGVPCAVRFCVDGTPAAEAARGSAQRVIDASRPSGAAPDSKYARMARTGIAEGDDAVPAASQAVAAEPDTSPSPGSADGEPGDAMADDRPIDAPGHDAGGDGDGNRMRLAAVVTVAVAVTVVLLAVLFVVSRGPVGGTP